MIIFLIKVRRSYGDLSSKLAPREIIELEVINISIKILISILLFCGTTQYNTRMKLILTRFDIKFLENAWGFYRGVTWRNELQ